MKMHHSELSSKSVYERNVRREEALLALEIAKKQNKPVIKVGYEYSQTAREFNALRDKKSKESQI